MLREGAETGERLKNTNSTNTSFLNIFISNLFSSLPKKTWVGIAIIKRRYKHKSQMSPALTLTKTRNYTQGFQTGLAAATNVPLQEPNMPIDTVFTVTPFWN